jgi:hypothetical protein
VGGFLDALARAFAASRRVASVAVITDAKDEDAQSFHEHYGSGCSRPNGMTVASSYRWGRSSYCSGVRTPPEDITPKPPIAARRQDVIEVE